MEDMMRFKIMGLCALAAFALSAASASAFSPPEVGRCVKVAAGTGNFTSGTCTKQKAKTEFEWIPGVAKGKFTSKGGVGQLTTLNGTTVVCKAQSSGGEYSGTKLVGGVVVKFTGCESAGFRCATAGAGEGEIVTNPLEGKIGIEKRYFNLEKKEVPLKNTIALDLFPTAADKGLYVTFNCGASLHITVGGSVLVPLKPTNKMISSITLKYVATKGVQKPENFEGEPADVLISEINGKKPEQSGITITSTQTGEEAAELNTVF
jgi:hypothetical protein